MLNLLVIRTSNPEELKTQYEHLGLTFEYHQHGKGAVSLCFECEWFCF